jgi:tight adherence protein B
MSQMVLVAIALAFVVLLGGAMLALFFTVGRGGGASSLRGNMRNIALSQRQDMDAAPAGSQRSKLMSAASQEEAVQKVSDTTLTLRKRLKFAQLAHVPPYLFAVSQVVISIIAFLITRLIFDLPLQILSLVTGILLMNWLLNFKIERRFKKFDRDYPQFLLSLVGLLKTGMNPVQSLDAAAQALEPDALVRQEVELMLERLKLGVPEERSIGSFGEDINHPEIELFVQALILSRRLGGNLSETLERLAKQVRKRQYFRQSAQAAVGLQRGSIVFILAILGTLELYLYFQWPECITLTWTHPTGRKVGHAGLIGILVGLWWVGQVTKIKV